ncbi:MAG: M48 family metallopeptidase [Lachnospira sp.]|nr:M48 family metallopeptidase [Lachnospira sp.]
MNIEIIRSNRRTMSLEVTSDVRVVVRAPRRMSDEQIMSFVNSKAEWLKQSVQKAQKHKEILDSSEKISDSEINRLKEQAQVVIPEKVRIYAEILQVSYGRITVRNQKTRWGSCSAKGNLNFNCLLMRAPEQIQDYVVVHELCHRKEMNHSMNFWREVEKVMPDYRERRKWLKENGSRLICCS